MAKKKTTTKKSIHPGALGASAKGRQEGREEGREEGGPKAAREAGGEVAGEGGPKPGSTSTSSAAGKADGNRTMKDTLGGKGANLAEMTNAGLPVPAGLHHLDRRLPRLLRRRAARCPPPSRRRCSRRSRSSRRPSARKLGVRQEAAARVGPLGRQVLDARDDGHHPEPRPQRRDRREPQGAHRQRPLRLRQLSPLHPDVRQRRPRDSARTPSSTSSRRSSTSAAPRSTPTSTRPACRRPSPATRSWCRRRPASRSRRIRRRRCAAPATPCSARGTTRARSEYRRIYDIPDEIGTAVNVQAMVFGNTGDRSATGVGFTRNPATGANEFFGEFLVNAQGEDVVAGIRTPQPIAELEKVMPAAYKELRKITSAPGEDLQGHPGLRVHDRGRQALHAADPQRQAHRLRGGPHRHRLRRREADEAAGGAAAGRARSAVAAAGAGVRSGRVEEAAGHHQGPAGLAGRGVGPGGLHRPRTPSSWTNAGKKVLLVRKETAPDDIHGMFVSQGILTATGGMTSHAAVVGRQMGKPSIVGAGALHIDEKGKTFTVGGQTVKEGDWVSFDGLSGEVKIGQVATKPSEILQVVAGEMKPEDSDIYRRFQQILTLVGQGADARHPRQRRPAGSGRARLRVRRARHRPVPHRAHVLRRRPHPDRPAR